MSVTRCTRSASATLQRFQLVERAGVVFGGSRIIAVTSYSIRLNSLAWTTPRDAMGIPARTSPTAPPMADGTAKWLRNWSTDASGTDSFAVRVLSTRLTAPGANTGTVDEMRYEERYDTSSSTTHLVTFARNVVFAAANGTWTNSTAACPDNGVGIATYTMVPRTSASCGGAGSKDTITSFDPSVSGRLMRDILTEVRQYPGKDGGQGLDNYEPDPGFSEFDGVTFPAGSVLRYQVSTQAEVPTYQDGTGNGTFPNNDDHATVATNVQATSFQYHQSRAVHDAGGDGGRALKPLASTPAPRPQGLFFG